MRITIISTSPRKASSSLRLAQYMKKVLDKSGTHQVECVQMEECDFPFVGRGSLDADNLTPFQADYIAKWAGADVIIFTIPEYNWTTGGEFINALHVLGGKAFAHLFDGKVFATAGVSVGRGGRMPAIEIGMVLSKVVSFLNKHSIISPKIFESHDTTQNIDAEGNFIGTERFESTTKDFLDYTLAIARRWL